MPDYILRVKDVTKEFPGVKALDNVNLMVERGAVHGLVGENGAGKSTLMKILSGVYPVGSYSGEIYVNDKPAQFMNTKDSEKASIGIIYQELTLAPELSIAENIFLGRMGGLINWEKINSEAKRITESLGLYENTETPVKKIGVGKQQLVEIAKAMALDANLLMLDEPTAALTEPEVAHLFGILRNIKNNGVTCIYISHKLEEVLAICDRVTIIRDGMSVGTYDTGELDEKKIISRMVGRDFSDRFPVRPLCVAGERILEARNINLRDFHDPDKYILKNINFHVCGGEILGIAGLMGAGRTELVNSVFGDFKGVMSGDLLIEGRIVKISGPIDAIRHGIGLVTEDRKGNGLNPIANIQDNMVMAGMREFSRWGVLNQNQMASSCSGMQRRLNIKAPSIEAVVRNLSGGNQQKVVLAKWLLLHSKVLIVDEPTRGIDVGAKYEIYCLLNELKESGMAIIMVSSELPEILGMSDRIIVLREGFITGEFINGESISEETLWENATGC
jgi:D-xylose transport system ATP-binding protein